MEFTGDLKKAVTVRWWKLLCPATLGFKRGDHCRIFLNVGMCKEWNAMA